MEMNYEHLESLHPIILIFHFIHMAVPASSGRGDRNNLAQ